MQAPAHSLTGRRILLGVSGGIAAYKSADLVRRLIERGAQVRVVMTQGAQAFVQPLTFQALSGLPVSTDLLDPAAEAAMGHIELARWAELIVIAPCSANTLARLAQGMADDLLSTLVLASQAPVLLAPAMNRVMWSRPQVQRNAALLQADGVLLVGPAAGEQACGEVGEGRMSEPLEIVAAVESALAPASLPLSGQRVLLTAGPTREAIDPVRYISNHSSGKMGYALAAEARAMGASVTLVSGPTALSCPDGVVRIGVESAAEMLEAVEAVLLQTDVFIAVAAVSDYRPSDVRAQKMKKSADSLSLPLVKNPDILATVAQRGLPIFSVGFAAETQQVAEYAKAKLQAKNLDMIAANDVASAQGVFNASDNALEVFYRDGRSVHIQRQPKAQVARALLGLIADELNASTPE